MFTKKISRTSLPEDRLLTSETLTEPSAVAPDTEVKLVCFIAIARLISTEDFSIRRIHHPSGAATPGTPVRARFCNSSA